MAKGKNTVETVTALARPVAEEMGLTLWDVRFEKEGASWYLRLFIDKPEGVDIVNCENFSRAVDKLLDEADPIEQSYYLEVGSPGIERELVYDWHFQQYLGEFVSVRLFRALEGRKELVGQLMAYSDGEISLKLDGETELKIPRAEAAAVKLYYDYDDMGGLEENE